MARGTRHWTETALVLRATKTTSLTVPTESVLDWSSPTTTATVRGSLQPATTEQIERAGLTAKRGLYALYCEPATILPTSNRVSVGSSVYRVLEVENWGTHVEVLMEEVSDAA